MDWERDDVAGGCLLRPALIRRLLALHATVERPTPDLVRVRAAARIVSALSPRHARLLERLGQPAELQLRLRFAHGVYTGGEEAYRVGRAVLLRLTARVWPPQALAQTPPARS